MTQLVLVTGGAGYIGGAAVRLLLQNNYQVTVLDNLSRGHRNSLPDGVPLVVGDTGDVRCLAELFAANKFDAVMHFAAFAEVGESMLQPARYFQNNTSSTLALLESCLTHRVSKFIFPRQRLFSVFRNPVRFQKRRPKIPSILTANQSSRPKLCSIGFIASTAFVTQYCVTSMPRERGTGMGSITSPSLTCYRMSYRRAWHGRPCPHLRHGLSNPRWNLRPRLHSYPRSGRRSSSRASGARSR
jgi:NAD(P)-dependent dehydrogenase (short-subunit alcohol dehydrogenase family)